MDSDSQSWSAFRLTVIEKIEEVKTLRGEVHGLRDEFRVSVNDLAIQIAQGFAEDRTRLDAIEQDNKERAAKNAKVRNWLLGILSAILVPVSVTSINTIFTWIVKVIGQ